MKSYTVKTQIRNQPKWSAAPFSNPSNCHLVLDPLMQTLVARIKANASQLLILHIIIISISIPKIIFAQL